jgi:hypothetical protein
MTTANIKLIHDAIGEAGKVAGFVKKGSAWYADRAESILVVSPQKSQYGEQYYLNVGIFFRVFGSNEKPKEHECHLRTRLTEIVGVVDQERARSLLDFKGMSVAESERQQALVTLLKEKGIPFLEQCSSIEGVRTALHQGVLNAMPISRVLRETLQAA